MPLFEYQCPSCASRFELLVRGASKARCPECGSSKVTRLLSVPARPVTTSAPAQPSCDSAPSGGCCGGGACGLN
jgi:putative FmdB family regulatory protein